MLSSMIAKTAMPSSGIAPAKMHAHRKSIVNAMIMAPKTMNGLRKSRRSARFRPFWIWFTSLVIRVMSVSVPSESSSR